MNMLAQCTPKYAENRNNLLLCFQQTTIGNLAGDLSAGNDYLQNKSSILGMVSYIMVDFEIEILFLPESNSSAGAIF
ncbi:MAG: hypothetical protein ACQEWG_03130 [Bacteroidota bacterium]